jgi:RecG-like helicase
MSLHPSLTKMQNEKLQAAGFQSLFDVITYFPYRLQRVIPLDSFQSEHISDSLFLFEGKLSHFSMRVGKGRFVQIDFVGNGRSIRGYLFAAGNYIFKQLIPGELYQVLLKEQNGLWHIKRLAQVQAEKSSKFVIGKLEMKEYLLPVYGKKGEITNTLLQAIHQRFSTTDYLLNLEGLIPEQILQTNILNLEQIHKPTTPQGYLETQRRWLKMQVFMKLSLLRYIDLQNSQARGITSQLDVNFLKQLTQSLPFELSSSQKQTIWDIVQEITVDSV